MLRLVFTRALPITKRLNNLDFPATVAFSQKLYR